MQCFHATVNRVKTRFPKETEVMNQETVSRVVFILVFRFADPSNVGRSLLDGNEDHLLNQATSELMKQEHQVESLNNFSFSNRLMLKDWNWRTPITDVFNLEENNLDHKKNDL